MTQDTDATEISIPESSEPLIPGFEIIRPLGKGGMGMVYLARQSDGLDREVAIKTILDKYLDQKHADYFRRKFLEEGQRQAEVLHPNILPIFSAGKAEGMLYLVMHYAGGGSLRDRMSKGNLELKEKLDVIFGVLEALRHAHETLEEPLAHLDVKPENILFDHSSVYLADFGIARKFQADGGPATVVAGDPRYWAPEQQENRASTQSDMFATGIMFFELLAGERPPDGLRVIANRSSARSLRKALPKPAQKYADLIARCLDPDPSNRPTASEALEELRALQRGPRRSLRYPLVAALVIAAAVLAIQPGIAERVQDLRDRLFPPEQYSMSFDLAPLSSALWIDGVEQTLRDVSLPEGEHTLVVVADGYVGQIHPLAVDGDTASFSVELAERPAITDEEYLEFSRYIAEEGPVEHRDWQDPTLATVAALDLWAKESSPSLVTRVSELRSLAAAGDEVAATSLFCAAFEGIDVDATAKSLLPGLLGASDSGYAVASMLRALYILQELLEAGQTFDSNPRAYAEVQKMLQRAARQGLPQSAGLAAAAAGVQLSL